MHETAASSPGRIDRYQRIKIKPVGAATTPSIRITMTTLQVDVFCRFPFALNACCGAYMQVLEPREVAAGAIKRWSLQTVQLMLRAPLVFGSLMVVAILSNQLVRMLRHTVVIEMSYLWSAHYLIVAVAVLIGARYADLGRAGTPPLGRAFLKRIPNVLLPVVLLNPLLLIWLCSRLSHHMHGTGNWSGDWFPMIGIPAIGALFVVVAIPEISTRLFFMLPLLLMHTVGTQGFVLASTTAFLPLACNLAFWGVGYLPLCIFLPYDRREATVLSHRGEMKNALLNAAVCFLLTFLLAFSALLELIGFQCAVLWIPVNVFFYVYYRDVFEHRTQSATVARREGVEGRISVISAR